MAIYARKKMVRKSVRKSRRVSGKPKLSSTIKKYVKKEVHRNIENKEKLNYVANQSIQVGNAGTSTYPLLMNIVQGTGDSDRVGNQIRTVKGQIKLCVNLRPYDVSTNPNPQPTWVRVLVVRDLKNSGQLSTMDATAWGCFWRGNNTTLGIQGNPLDMNFEVNKDYFRLLYDKVFKLGIGNHISGPTNPSSYFDNSPMAKKLTINWGKFAKKQLKFTEGNNYPNNDNLYIVFLSCSADGTGSFDKQQIEVHYANYQHYEDS